MALQFNKDKTYLKIDENGNYVIYKNKTARNKEKKINVKEIIDKYNEILSGYHITAELAYYAPEIVEEYFAWKEEYQNYLIMLDSKRTLRCEFPLMSQYFPNIKDSLPLIIAEGSVGIPKNKTVKEAYEYIKQHETFGKIDDVKDV